jgi:S-adenosylmethionine:tRNA ribosyltransferase-isomerase
VVLDTLDFTLSPDQEAGEPPEARGLARDQVRLMVSTRAGDRVEHRRFRDLPEVLRPGDLLVINTSGTLKAALPARRRGGRALELHLSTRLPADLWIVEMRVPQGPASKPYGHVCSGDVFHLPGGARATLHAPYDHAGRTGDGPVCGGRLWVASLSLPCPWSSYLERHGEPIRYAYAKEAWPASYYQTVYATEPGSAELASAGRAFTPELITRLVASGVQVAPLLLHAGVSSLEEHEPPYEEYYRVPLETARAVNAARRERRRVIAVGTTAVRALETVTVPDGEAHPGEGWTRLVITPERGMKVVDGLLTGLHEPRASHLAMLEALAGRQHLRVTYDAALAEGYLWHEFGDLHLILP